MAAVTECTTMRRDANAIKVSASSEVFAWIRATAQRDGIAPELVVIRALEAAMSTCRAAEPVLAKARLVYHPRRPIARYGAQSPGSLGYSPCQVRARDTRRIR